MKWLALTRVFRLGSILKFAVPAALALSAGGFWAGQQWQAGRQAQNTLRVIAAEQATADQQTAHRHQAAADYEQRRTDRTTARHLRDAELRAYLAARPDLWGCDVGADGLRLIRSWAAHGARPDTAEPDRTVPDAAADTGDRPGARPADDDERVE